jgi:hypothetical protein
LRRIVFTHITFERKAGIGFFEKFPGWARSPAEGTLVVFLSINHIFVSPHTFGCSILTRVYRNIYVFQRVANHLDARPRRIIAAIFRRSVKGGADYFTGPATIALVSINFYCFDDFLFLLAHG